MTFISLNKREKVFSGVYLVFQLLVLPLILIFLSRYVPFLQNDAYLNFAFFCINFLCCVLFCKKYLLRCLKSIGQAPGRFAVTVLLALPMYNIASIVIGLLIMQIMPDFFNVNDFNISAMAGSDFWLTAIGTVLLVPLVEEILYRGLIFGSIYRRSKGLAYVISVVVFSAIHVIGYIGMYEPAQLLLCLLQYIPAGLCLGWAYARTGTIFAPALIHAIINAYGIAAMR